MLCPISDDEIHYLKHHHASPTIRYHVLKKEDPNLNRRKIKRPLFKFRGVHVFSHQCLPFLNFSLLFFLYHPPKTHASPTQCQLLPSSLFLSGIIIQKKEKYKHKIRGWALFLYPPKTM